MSDGYVSSLPEKEQKYVVFYMFGGGLLSIAFGTLWIMEMLGYFDRIPGHQFFLPMILVVGGVLVFAKAVWYKHSLPTLRKKK
jgi:uncharacterized membrane protein